jgi:hypothetical protein
VLGSSVDRALVVEELAVGWQSIFTVLERVVSESEFSRLVRAWLCDGFGFFCADW